ncbi:hypothetical protein J6590_065447 [Homalodisca vitripennis]|nr:hypothetical protein J6590_065447 [Homalodisca vitripennis]
MRNASVMCLFLTLGCVSIKMRWRSSQEGDTCAVRELLRSPFHGFISQTDVKYAFISANSRITLARDGCWQQANTMTARTICLEDLDQWNASDGVRMKTFGLKYNHLRGTTISHSHSTHPLQKLGSVLSTLNSLRCRAITTWVVYRFNITSF